MKSEILTKIEGTQLSRFDEGWITGNIYLSSDMYDLSENALNNNNNHQPFGLLQTIYDVQVKVNTQRESDGDFHPHKNVDIISYVVDGTLYDGIGDLKLLTQHGYVNGAIGYHNIFSERGDIQYIRSGAGIHHSVYSKNNQPLRFIQLFIAPQQEASSPAYETHTLQAMERQGQWLQLASGIKGHAPLTLQQDMNIYVTELKQGEQLPVHLDSARQACILLIEGHAKLDNITLHSKDAALLRGKHDSLLQAKTDAHVMLIDMQKE